MNAFYDRFLQAYQWQNQITLMVFAGAAAVMAATWLFNQSVFMRKWILPVWTVYLIAMFAGALLYGVYGR